MAPPRKSQKQSADDAAVKKKPNRRDMDKRREQNRQSQKTYREKQRQRIEELERLATSLKTAEDSTNLEEEATPSYPSADTTKEPFSSEPYRPLNSNPTPIPQNSDLIDPSLLTVSSSSTSLAPHISPANFLQFSSFYFPADTNIFFECGCTTLHIPAPDSPFLLPIRPRAFSLHANTLRLDFECTLSALLRNCLHLGIAKSQFCADESESLFYRPRLPSAEDESNVIEDEASKLVSNTLTLFRTVKHDLRPLSSQITESHHPYIDVLPFKDLRENLVSMQGQIDEDEFLHDWFNQATCWGGAKGSRGGGMPWEGRNWELTEDFLRKWEVVTGGDEGELARGSRWWRAMRGELAEEVV